MANESRPVMVLGEFETADSLMDAAEKVRDEGFTHWDCYTPYPVHGLDGKMGIRATALPWIVLGGGLTGCTIGFIMQWYMNVYDYPFLISGKPVWSVPANVPVSFELTILLAGLATVFGLLFRSKLLPGCKADVRDLRVTDDRFALIVTRPDAAVSDAALERLWRDTGATETRDYVEGEDPR